MEISCVLQLFICNWMPVKRFVNTCQSKTWTIRDNMQIKKILKNTVTNNCFLKIIFKSYFFVKPSCPAAAVLQQTCHPACLIGLMAVYSCHQQLNGYLVASAHSFGLGKVQHYLSLQFPGTKPICIRQGTCQNGRSHHEPRGPDSCGSAGLMAILKIFQSLPLS